MCKIKLLKLAPKIPVIFKTFRVNFIHFQAIISIQLLTKFLHT